VSAVAAAASVPTADRLATPLRSTGRAGAAVRGAASSSPLTSATRPHSAAGAASAFTPGFAVARPGAQASSGTPGRAGSLAATDARGGGVTAAAAGRSAGSARPLAAAGTTNPRSTAAPATHSQAQASPGLHGSQGKAVAHAATGALSGAGTRAAPSRHAAALPQPSQHLAVSPPERRTAALHASPASPPHRRSPGDAAGASARRGAAVAAAAAYVSPQSTGSASTAGVAEGAGAAPILRRPHGRQTSPVAAVARAGRLAVGLSPQRTAARAPAAAAAGAAAAARSAPRANTAGQSAGRATQATDLPSPPRSGAEAHSTATAASAAAPRETQPGKGNATAAAAGGAGSLPRPPTLFQALGDTKLSAALAMADEGYDAKPSTLAAAAAALTAALLAPAATTSADAPPRESAAGLLRSRGLPLESFMRETAACGPTAALVLQRRSVPLHLSATAAAPAAAGHWEDGALAAAALHSAPASSEPPAVLVPRLGIGLLRVTVPPDSIHGPSRCGNATDGLPEHGCRSVFVVCEPAVAEAALARWAAAGHGAAAAGVDTDASQRVRSPVSASAAPPAAVLSLPSAAAALLASIDSVAAGDGCEGYGDGSYGGGSCGADSGYTDATPAGASVGAFALNAAAGASVLRRRSGVAGAARTAHVGTTDSTSTRSRSHRPAEPGSLRAAVHAAVVHTLASHAVSEALAVRRASRSSASAAAASEADAAHYARGGLSRDAARRRSGGLAAAAAAAVEAVEREERAAAAASAAAEAAGDAALEGSGAAPPARRPSGPTADARGTSLRRRSGGVADHLGPGSAAALASARRRSSAATASSAARRRGSAGGRSFMGLPAAAAAAAAGLDALALAALAAQSDAADAGMGDTAGCLRANGHINDAVATLPYPDDDDAASVTLSLRSIERSVHKAATSVVMAGAAAMARTSSSAARGGVGSSGYNSIAHALHGPSGSSRAVTPARFAVASRPPAIRSAGRPAPAGSGARAAAHTHAHAQQQAPAPSAAAALLQECSDLMAEADAEGGLVHEGSGSDATARGVPSLAGALNPALHILLWPAGALPRSAEGSAHGPDMTSARTDDGIVPAGACAVVPGTACVGVDALPIVSWSGELLVLPSGTANPGVASNTLMEGDGAGGIARASHSAGIAAEPRVAPGAALRVGDVVLGVHFRGASTEPSSTSTDVVSASGMALADLATLLRRCRLGSTGAVPVADGAAGPQGSLSSSGPGALGHVGAAAPSRAQESTHAEGACSGPALEVTDAVDSAGSVITSSGFMIAREGWRQSLIVARPVGRSVEWH
jgi:hypothetical protein